jgi:hypothetical protein
MEPLPDFTKLDDADLVRLIDELSREEDQISQERRLLQGRLDILLGEQAARANGGSLASPNIDQLAAVLSHKGLPQH